jgi:hypothetical protein
MVVYRMQLIPFVTLPQTPMIAVVTDVDGLVEMVELWDY